MDGRGDFEVCGKNEILRIVIVANKVTLKGTEDRVFLEKIFFLIIIPPFWNMWKVWQRQALN